MEVELDLDYVEFFSFGERGGDYSSIRLLQVKDF